MPGVSWRCWGGWARRAGSCAAYVCRFLDDECGKKMKREKVRLLITLFKSRAGDGCCHGHGQLSPDRFVRPFQFIDFFDSRQINGHITTVHLNVKYLGH
jgi:hypothetical protein